MGQADAVRRIDVERLGLGGIQRAGGRITAVADTDIAPQFVHMPLLEDIADQPVLLAGAQRAIPVGHHPGGVLATVLQDGQRIIDRLIDRPMADDADDATHVRAGLPCCWATCSRAASRSSAPTAAAYGISLDSRHQGSAAKPPISSARTRIPASTTPAGHPKQHAENPVRAGDYAPADEITDQPGDDAAGKQHTDEQGQPSRPGLPERILQRSC